ncbi:MAG: hypothetical protein AAGD14_15740, partial [Planctomycetota bacterium]
MLTTLAALLLLASPAEEVEKSLRAVESLVQERKFLAAWARIPEKLRPSLAKGLVGLASSYGVDPKSATAEKVLAAMQEQMEETAAKRFALTIAKTRVWDEKTAYARVSTNLTGLAIALRLEKGAEGWRIADTRAPGAYAEVLASLPSDAAREYWTAIVLKAQRDPMVASAAAAVGINMTFLMPWALRARGWGKKHRTLSRFDLVLGMMIPFILATGCVVIAAGSQFHGKPFEGLLTEANGVVIVHEESGKFEDYSKAISAREKAVPDVALDDGERKLAAMLIKRDTNQLA